MHDSGAERVLVADVAERVGVPFAPLAPATTTRLAAALDPGLTPANPLDVWGGGRDTEDLFTECLSALADDPEVDVVALAVDLVPEYDGDVAFPNTMTRLLELTPKPVVVLANLSAAVDQAAAGRLRTLGIPVLEGTGPGWWRCATSGHPPLPRAGTPRSIRRAGSAGRPASARTVRAPGWQRRCSPTTASRSHPHGGSRAGRMPSPRPPSSAERWP